LRLQSRRESEALVEDSESNGSRNRAKLSDDRVIIRLVHVGHDIADGLIGSQRLPENVEFPPSQDRVDLGKDTRLIAVEM
jgi:hypothetical protein